MDQTEFIKMYFGVIIDAIKDQPFDRIVIEIEFQAKSAGFHSWLYYNNIKQSVNLKFGLNEAKALWSHHEYTQTQPPIHADWNKAVFTLYPDGKVNMEYIWDAEYQAECDAVEEKARKEIERRRKISESLRKKKTEQLMENDWAKAILAGKEVKVEIRAIFDVNSKRPNSFEPCMAINSTTPTTVEVMRQE